MKKELNEIMRHSGKVWLTQAIIDLAESLNPTRKKMKLEKYEVGKPSPPEYHISVFKSGTF